MSERKIWSWLTPLLVIAAMIFGFSILWNLEGERIDDVATYGLETTATVYDEGKRFIKLSYDVDGTSYSNSVAKGFSNIEDGEQFLMKYDPKDLENIVVLFDSPILSNEHEYEQTDCTSMSKTLSIIDFYYDLSGTTYRRKTPFRNHTMSPINYVVMYRTNNPQIGYLVEKEN